MGRFLQSSGEEGNFKHRYYLVLIGFNRITSYHAVVLLFLKYIIATVLLYYCNVLPIHYFFSARKVWTAQRLHVVDGAEHVAVSPNPIQEPWCAGIRTRHRRYIALPLLFWLMR